MIAREFINNLQDIVVRAYDQHNISCDLKRVAEWEVVKVIAFIDKRSEKIVLDIDVESKE